MLNAFSYRLKEKKSHQLKKGARHVGFARENKTKQILFCRSVHFIPQNNPDMSVLCTPQSKTHRQLAAIERPHTAP